MKTLSILALALIACGCAYQPTADDKQNRLQETLTAQGVATVGLPAISNFREKKILKDIFERRDKMSLVTYTYIFSEVTGKFTYLGQSVGYGISAATQYTAPEKIDGNSSSYVTIPQADPNGLYSPSSAEGTWVLLTNSDTHDVEPIYVESRILVSTFKLRAEVIAP